MNLSKRQIRFLLTFLTVLLLTSAGVGYGHQDDIAQFLQSNQPGDYKVSSVEDGDTITVNMDGRAERVRLIGVDTPELHHPEKPVQCFAEAARQFLTNLIDSQPVRLMADPLDDNRDLYGRLLRYVYLPDGTLVNTEIVKQGYGFAYTWFPFTKVEEVRQLEREAREAKRGLWSGCTIDQTDEGPETNPVN